jgi:hypothetical protein
MKKLLVIFFALTVSSAAMAEEHRAFGDHWGGHAHYEYRSNAWVWVVPTIIGGVIGYEIAKSQPAPQTVITVQQPPQVCSPWYTILNPDGSQTQTRTCR